MSCIILSWLWEATTNSSQAWHLRQPAYGRKRLVVLQHRDILINSHSITNLSIEWSKTPIIAQLNLI